MARIHFLNVLEGDCNIIQHDSGRVTVIDVSNAYNELDTDEELAVKNSPQRANMKARNFVPPEKINYRMKEVPDNPITYLKALNITTIFRFIISHPDMDHLDGIRDLYSDFEVINTWDTNNNKVKERNSFFAGYNWEDWSFYSDLRAGNKSSITKRLTPLAGDKQSFWNEDYITILSPTSELVNSANQPNGDIHDASFVILYTPPKTNGGFWKILFAGDSHDNTWNFILSKYKLEVSNIDVLFAPHHGRDSGRDFGFLSILKPRITLLGNASSKHLNYSNYPKIRITNNQAGFVILDIKPEGLTVYVENGEFARDFCKKRKNSDGTVWQLPSYNQKLHAFPLFFLSK